jgi:hypothetical protein
MGMYDWHRQSTHRHISISDRLDLLQSMPFNDPIERREIIVQLGDEFVGLQHLRELRESHKIAEEDRHSLIIPWFNAAFMPQFVCDLLRKNIGQKALAFGPFEFELAVSFLEFEKLPSQFKLSAYLVGKTANGFRLREAQLPRLKIHYA